MHVTQAKNVSCVANLAREVKIMQQSLTLAILENCCTSIQETSIQQAYAEGTQACFGTTYSYTF